MNKQKINKYLNNINYNLPKELLLKRLYEYLRNNKINDEESYYLIVSNEYCSNFIEEIITSNLNEEEIDFIKNRVYLNDLICYWADLNDFENENIVNIRSKKVIYNENLSNMFSKKIMDKENFSQLIKEDINKAKQEFIKEYIQFINSIVYRFIKLKKISYDYYDDLFQQSILIIYKKFESLDFEKNIYIYLSIMINGALNRYLKNEILSVKYSQKDRNEHSFNYLLKMQVPFEENDINDDFETIKNIEMKLDLLLIDECLNTLTEQEKAILETRYGFIDGQKHTLEETGRYFEKSRETIRQKEKSALKKLRKSKKAKLLKENLEYF